MANENWKKKKTIQQVVEFSTSFRYTLLLFSLYEWYSYKFTACSIIFVCSIWVGELGCLVSPMVWHRVWRMKPTFPVSHWKKITVFDFIMFTAVASDMISTIFCFSALLCMLHMVPNHTGPFWTHTLPQILGKSGTNKGHVWQGWMPLKLPI